MPVSLGLSHVAMSVPEGTLTDEYRARLLEFYGRMLGWREMEALRRPDRLTIAVGGSTSINLRERPDSMVSHGYEHLGVRLGSSDDLRTLWSDLADDPAEVELEPLSLDENGEGLFRFRYLLPTAVEPQFFGAPAGGAGDELDALMATLESLRAGVLTKVTSISDADARRTTVPSGTNLAGLVQHLTFVESKWFERTVAGRKPSRGKRMMQVDPSVTLSALRTAYRDACATSDAIITAMGDPAAATAGGGKKADLRSAILAVIAETARHAGHADILREQLDAKTGR
jgi:hypothetical protein